MKTARNLIMVVTIIATSCLYSKAQEVTSYMYRQIPQGKLNEVIEKEQKYWSKVARKAIDDGKLTFWAVLVKQGDFNVPESPNVLYIVTFKDINKQGDIWDKVAELFPNAKPEEYNTWGPEFGTGIMHQLYVNASGWQAKEVSGPADYNYIKFVYHNTESPAAFVNVENENWGPFIKKEMDAGNTKQVAWGNALLLPPRGPKVPFNSVSYDLYKTFGDALMPGGIEIPEGFWAPFDEIEAEPRMEMIYHIVAAESAQ